MIVVPSPLEMESGIGAVPGALRQGGIWEG